MSRLRQDGGRRPHPVPRTVLTPPPRPPHYTAAQASPSHPEIMNHPPLVSKRWPCQPPLVISTDLGKFTYVPLPSLTSRLVIIKYQETCQASPQGYPDHQGSLLQEGADVRLSFLHAGTPASRQHHPIDVCRSVARALHARRDGSTPPKGNTLNGQRVGTILLAIFCSSPDQHL